MLPLEHPEVPLERTKCSTTQLGPNHLVQEVDLAVHIEGSVRYRRTRQDALVLGLLAVLHHLLSALGARVLDASRLVQHHHHIALAKDRVHELVCDVRSCRVVVDGYDDKTVVVEDAVPLLFRLLGLGRSGHPVQAVPVIGPAVRRDLVGDPVAMHTVRCEDDQRVDLTLLVEVPRGVDHHLGLARAHLPEEGTGLQVLRDLKLFCLMLVRCRFHYQIPPIL